MTETVAATRESGYNVPTPFWSDVALNLYSLHNQRTPHLSQGFIVGHKKTKSDNISIPISI